MFEVDKFLYGEAMKYYDKTDEQLSEALQVKRRQILENNGNNYIASRKWDGEWAMIIVDELGVFVRSRNKNVKGTYDNKVGKIPQIFEDASKLPCGTVLLAELCWTDRKSTSTDVGTIMRCLESKAVRRQGRDGWLKAKVFDILSWDGVDISDTPYIERIKKIDMLKQYKLLYISSTTFILDDFEDMASDIIAECGEGIVIQRKDNTYEWGRRSAWHSLKLKQKLAEVELQIIDTIKANKEYAGKNPNDWKYWELTDDDGNTTIIDCQSYGDGAYNKIPVSKPYALGWMMGVRCDYNGVKIDVSSGLTDTDREWLATDEATDLINNNMLFASVRGMMKSRDGAIRHPVVTRLRIMTKEDKNS